MVFIQKPNSTFFGQKAVVVDPYWNSLVKVTLNGETKCYQPDHLLQARDSAAGNHFVDLSEDDTKNPKSTSSDFLTVASLVASQFAREARELAMRHVYEVKSKHSFGCIVRPGTVPLFDCCQFDRCQCLRRVLQIKVTGDDYVPSVNGTYVRHDDIFVHSDNESLCFFFCDGHWTIAHKDDMKAVDNMNNESVAVYNLPEHRPQLWNMKVAWQGRDQVEVHRPSFPPLPPLPSEVFLPTSSLVA